MKLVQKSDHRGLYRSSAKVVDGSLILSLPDAVNPIVWRMELGSVKASALEVRTNENNLHMLILKTPRGDTHEIAPYATREYAVDALMQASSALSAGSSAVTHVNPPVHEVRDEKTKDRSSALKWLAALGGVILVIALFAYLGSLGSPQLVDGIPGESTATTVTGDANAESGVPQSADQLLRGF